MFLGSGVSIGWCRFEVFVSGHLFVFSSSRCMCNCVHLHSQAIDVYPDALGNVSLVFSYFDSFTPF